ncbi:hypothetical protein EJB05_01907, partial [Eragrostis curvula]
MESLWDRLPRGIVKELTRGGFKRGDALPHELVDHFEELDRLTGRNALVEVPVQPVPLAIVPPGVIIISDDEGPEEAPARPSQCSGVASGTRTSGDVLVSSYSLSVVLPSLIGCPGFLLVYTKLPSLPVLVFEGVLLSEEKEALNLDGKLDTSDR